MSKKILLEDSWSFCPNRENIITESNQKTGTISYKIPGTLSLCDTVNGNNRKYPRKVWEKNLSEDSHLKKLIKNTEAFGLLEHPESGMIDLRSPISHVLTDAKLESNGTVTGEIMILDTVEGRKLKVLIEAGYNPLVSSRGFGSLIKTSDGIDEVQDDFICEGWDVVFKPSFTAAQLRPTRESADVVRENLTPISENVSKVDTVAPITRPGGSTNEPTIKENTHMDLEDIRRRVSSLKSVTVASMNPRQVSEGFSNLTNLHREIAQFQAANPASSWDCQQLHEEITLIENLWNTAIAAPKTELTKVSESNKKLLAVAETATKTAIAYRNQLSETAAKAAKSEQLFEDVLQRGRGWKSLAEARKTKLDVLENKLDVACRALDIIAERFKKLNEKFTLSHEALDYFTERYHADTAKLAIALVSEQLKGKISDDDAKALSESKTAAKALEIKKKYIAPPVTETKVEGKKEDVMPSEKPTITESKKTEEQKNLQGEPAPATTIKLGVQPTRNINSLSESVEVAKRLGKK